MEMRTTLSVRGEARRTVAPDYVVVRLSLRAEPTSRTAALAWLRAAQDRLIDDLQHLGGTPLTVDTDGADLTWSFGSVEVHDEHDLDDATGRHGPTGRVHAAVSATLALRRLDQVPALTRIVGDTEHLHVNDVAWRVDPDNDAWPVVRADAIAAALVKARDYAVALGGSVTTVEHVADAGLLTGIDHGRAEVATQRSLRGPAAGMGGDGMPVLDPVPQEIRATVEARVVATVDPLRAD